MQLKHNFSSFNHSLVLLWYCGLLHVHPDPAHPPDRLCPLLEWDVGEECRGRQQQVLVLRYVESRYTVHQVCKQVCPNPLFSENETWDCFLCSQVCCASLSCITLWPLQQSCCFISTTPNPTTAPNTSSSSASTLFSASSYLWFPFCQKYR